MKRFFAKIIKFWRTLLAALVCAALFPAQVTAADWEYSSAINFDTGNYGGRDQTDSVYIPFTVKRNYLNAELALTVPYVRQNTAGQITRAGGKPVRFAVGNRAATRATAAGLGDITLNGAYTLKVDGPASFDLALGGRLKLPTARKSGGLGTGELDEGAGLEFAKEISPSWTLLADGYYTIMGDPEGADFNNEFSVDIGFYRPLRKNLGLTVIYETQSALVDGTADPRSLSGTLSYSGAGGVQFGGGLTLGLSDGSPDIGIGAGFNGKF